MQKRALNILLGICLFLLPWQTRWIFGQSLISGEFFEFGTWSLYAIEILVILVFLLFLLMNKIIVREKWMIGVSLFILFAGLSSIWAIDGNLALANLIHIIIASLLLIMLVQPIINLKWMAGAFIAGLFIPGIIAIVQFQEGATIASKWFGLAYRDVENLGDSVIISSDGSRTLRAYGSFSHPNIFGGYLSVGLLFLLMLIKDLKSKLWRYRFGVTGLFGLFILILTWSQSAWLALLTSSGVYIIGLGIIAMKKNGVDILRLAQIIAGSFIGFMFLAVIGIALMIGGEARSMNERIIQYQELPQIIEDTFIYGHGLGNYTLGIHKTFPDREWWEYQPIHNVFCLLFGELGIVGILIIVSGFTVIILNVIRNQTKDQSIFSISLLLLIVILCLFDHFLYSSWSGLALVALTSAFMLKNKHQIEV